MIPVFSSRLQLLLVIGDLSIVLLAIYLVPALRFGVLPEFPAIFEWPDLFFTFSIILSYYLADLYDKNIIFQRARMAIRIMFAAFFSFLFVATTFYALNLRPLGTVSLSLNIIFIVIFTFLWRWTASFWVAGIRPPMRIAILGKNRAGMELAAAIKEVNDFIFIGFIEDLMSQEKGAKIEHIVNHHNIHSMVVSDASCVDDTLRSSLMPVKIAGVSIFEMPVFFELNFRRIPVEHIDDSWFIFSRITGVSRTFYNTKLKRLLDIMASIFLLIFFSPFSLIIACLIKIDSPGPVLFIQRRLGLNDRPFLLYKFRTMVVGKENDRLHAGSDNDPRITKLGKILRKSRLDEIPQLWNVLKGDMSLIGPRALMEEEVQEFKKSVPFFHLRHTVRPGITGWAQVNYPHGVTREDALRKLEYDLYYIKHLSAALDLVIALKTLNVLLHGKGAK